MTDRHAGYLVTLADDLREDDAEATLAALRMIRGVVKVEPLVSSFEVQVAKARADAEWRTRIANLVTEI